MTPKEKAKELTRKFSNYAKEEEFLIGSSDNVNSAQQCALIAVEEIIRTGLLSKSRVKHQAIADVHEEYWNQVKTEIEKL